MAQICVVEDDALVRFDAVLLLEEAGFRVVEFETVDQALSFVEKNAPEIRMIFTDVRTPGIFDGITLAEIVALSWPWVNVLVTSGTDSPDRLPPQASFLPKPWRPAELLARAVKGSRPMIERKAEKGL
jgi:CheY-like chemotaxis protein